MSIVTIGSTSFNIDLFVIAHSSEKSGKIVLRTGNGNVETYEVVGENSNAILHDWNTMGCPYNKDGSYRHQIGNKPPFPEPAYVVY